MKRSFQSMLVAGLGAMVVLIFAACGGGEEEPKATPTPARPATPAASPAATPARSPAAASPAASPAVSGPLADLLAKARQGEFQVTYDLKFKEATGAPQEGTLTLATKAGKSSIAFSGKVENEKVEVTIIDDGKDVYLCGAFTGKDKACFKAPREGGAGPAGELLSTFQELNPATLAQELGGGQIRPDGSQTIAGRKASCFRGSGPEGEGRICVEEKLGVPLLVQGKSKEGEGDLKATKFSDKVSDDAFKPPYKVQDIKELFGGRLRSASA